ncbi:polysaccharide deacetylase family protein [Roseateles toxinivorans]|uniref:Peptidoglycan/xylan/chitin deacetylase (PgdA/CDA1 family) n=1 Tax=Roseateles toxinivorans TaxID=270368 RepID=A0A4R6QL92_9BURK|nr:polysaccharide deacetylase family protein [Roseateles toxinivorans]TDP62832.1 peptidoglycan/xylan/chitin deacetylase (PgdA/CDA1 family) [Roseateles toxinivorans]
MKKLVALLLALGMAQASHADTFKWPGGAKAAVSLSYDDALNSQLDNALPALNAHGLRATFYLTLASEVVAKRLPEWRRAAAQGHELGNHTLYHPCSRSKPGRDWVAPHRDLDKIGVAQLREEILLANAYLQAIDGRTERTFTAPCGDLLAAGQPYLPAIRSGFVAIKSRAGGVAPDMAGLDPYDVGTAGPDGASGEALIAIVKEAAAKGTLASITFHGIGGDHLAVSTEAHEALLKHLAANPEVYWVDSFVNIMGYLASTRKR